jgi:hypothetical protein
MKKVQRIDGDALEIISKINDSVRYILLPSEMMSYCSLIYSVLYILSEYMRIMTLDGNI